MSVSVHHNVESEHYGALWPVSVELNGLFIKGRCSRELTSHCPYEC